MATVATELPERKPKKPWLAALLNLIPLLGLVGCSPDNKGGPFSLICFALLVWGIGYLYLGGTTRNVVRCLVALALPWILIPVTWIFNPFDFEHSYEHTFTFKDFQPFLIVLGSACLLTAVDAMRLAASDNAKLERATKGAVGPPAPLASPGR